MSYKIEEKDALWRIPEWFKELRPETTELLRCYHLNLIKWTKTVNLISPGTIYEADKVHIADAILGCQKFHNDIPKDAEIYDLGSGNGIPGVVLAILRPDLLVTCADSDERKIGFLKNLALQVDLKNLRTKCARIESLEKAQLKFGMARGLASLEKLLVLSESLFESGATFYNFKGAEWRKELDLIPAPLANKWKTAPIAEYDLPEGSGSRAILKSIKV